jgi:alpha-L-rhamnosidase
MEGKDRVFEPLWWRTWRYVDVAVETEDEPLTLDRMEAYFTGIHLRQRRALDRAIRTCRRSGRLAGIRRELDAHETYMDYSVLRAVAVCGRYAAFRR